MSHQPERAIRSILVCGDNAVAAAAALAFARALPQVRVSLLALGDDRPDIGQFAAASMPEVRRFHAAIGLDEAELIGRGVAVHQLGTRFENWPEGRSWFHVFGDYGVPEWPVLFHHLWIRAGKSGSPEPYHRYSAAAVIAEAGKFVHPQPGRWPLSSYRYAFRFRPQAYRDLLREHAARAGVASICARVVQVDRADDGGIVALRLDDGRRIDADLFVDCSGPDAVLHDSDEFEDWGLLFPFNRLNVEWEEGTTTPTDSVELTGDGWRWSQPLPQRTLVTTASAEGAGTAFRYGRRRRPWIANVVAIGEAAATIDPLYGVNLHLAHSAILRALELLPGRDFDRVEIEEYNRRTDQEVIRARDFLALHYLGPESEVPDSLAHTLDQFAERGRLPFYAEESFTRDSWVAALLAMGIEPRHADSIAARMTKDDSDLAMEKLAANLAALPEQLPNYHDYLARMTAAASRSIFSPAAS